MKKILLLLMLALSAVSSQATVLLQDSTNYPYSNGPIAGQGKWYVVTTPVANDAVVTNNVIYMTSTNKDTIATPTNGFYADANGSIIWASFTLKMTALPPFTDFNDKPAISFYSTNGNFCCSLFIKTNDAVLPNTFRLAIANYSTSFSNLQKPVVFPEDLALNVTYNVIIAYDSEVGSVTEGANLMVNPSATDYNNLENGASEGSGFVYATDSPVNSSKSQIYITHIEFAPFFDGGFSNLLVGTTYQDVVQTNYAPVFGLQPVSSTNYSGNSLSLSAIASGSDVTYQWYSTTAGALADDGVSIIGSTSNTLTLNNLSASGTYYSIATDATHQTGTSSNAVITVITTPTPVFFAASVTANNLTNNLFTSATFSDPAQGTGPINYQWFFKSTNSGSTFVALSGQNGSSLNLNLADYSYVGQYYVVASNFISGGSLAFSPTNTLVETAPLIATMEQLHNFLDNNINQIQGNPAGTVYINSNNITVSGYVSTYRGYGTSYTAYFIQDTNGYGVEVFLSGNGNTNCPPIGTYVTVSAPLEVYHSGLEMAPTVQSAITTNAALPVALSPFFGNPYYADFTANPIGSNALRYTGSLVTFTNVYIYGSSAGGAIGSGGAQSGVGGIFTSNSYTLLYITVGTPYDSVTNNKTMEVFQPTYDYRTSSGSSIAPNPFDLKPIPTHLTQLTGVILPYGGTTVSSSYVEVIPSRYEDYCTNTPTAFTTYVSVTNKTAGLSWPAITGATYSVLSASSVTGPWTIASTGINYFPTNGAFSQAIGVSNSFFKITSP